ncbi:DUF4365 domain-containing protein [Saccharothrix australiensis]|uniref:DUF4365 domain-containing protein n=1 Tax=Saccharothrix australiensis TaxID=2072 RepID=UPI000EAC6A99
MLAAGDGNAVVATLHDSAAKARYGVAYVRSICSQAGIGFIETSPDEDVLAVDGEIQYLPASARVQVKCTSKFTIAGNSASWPCDVSWRQKWSAAQVPVYVVLVILEHDLNTEWIAHPAIGTDHRSAAFWVRVNTGIVTDRISIPKAQRFTAETLTEWHKDVVACFTPAEQGMTA